MTRYFIDTNVLVGLTFLHDRWTSEVERILLGDNTLYTSEFVIYEYCSRKPDSPSVVPDPSDIEVSSNDSHGVYGRVLKTFEENVEENIPLYNRDIDYHHYDGLSLNKIVEIFFDHIEVREQAKPHFVRHFQEYFSSRKATPRNAKRCVEDLRDRFLHDAQKRKDLLMDSVYVRPSTYHEQERPRERIEEHIGINQWGMPIEDVQWFLDAVGLCQQGVVKRIVTGDKKDVVQHQQQLTSLFDVSVLYILDEFHTDSSHANSQSELAQSRE